MPVDISEYTNTAFDARGNTVPAGQEPANATQSFPVTGISSVSTSFSDVTRLVRVHTDVPLRYAFGATPMATAASPRMAAGSTEFFGVSPGHKLAVISTT